MVRYQVKIHDDSGNLVHIIREAEMNLLEMTVVENEVGTLEIRMPAEFLDFEIVRTPDRILTVERDTGSGFKLECGPGAERGFFLRDIEYETDEYNNNFINLYAFDGNYLLDSRLVAYANDSAQAKKTDQADDMLLIVVRENLGADATDADRRLTRLSVESGNGNGVNLTKNFARANVLSTLKSIADESWNLGEYLVFDTVYIAPGKFEFRVYRFWRGEYLGIHSTNVRTVIPTPCVLRWSRQDERNYIYAGGQGAKEARTIQTAYNQDWINGSIWNRREGWANSSNTDDVTSILAAARSMLYKNRPRWIVSGKIKDTEGQRYGIDYHWGDIVVVRYMGINLDVHIAGITLRYEAGKETVTATMRSENE